MNKELIKLLIQALELVSITATQAWWKGRAEHCGSDFDINRCLDCFAYNQCTSHEVLIGLFKTLKQAVD